VTDGEAFAVLVRVAQGALVEAESEAEAS
jgi:hypothetical protein